MYALENWRAQTGLWHGGKSEFVIHFGEFEKNEN